jgi:hypothetical protein
MLIDNRIVKAISKHKWPKAMSLLEERKLFHQNQNFSVQVPWKILVTQNQIKIVQMLFEITPHIEKVTNPLEWLSGICEAVRKPTMEMFQLLISKQQNFQSRSFSFSWVAVLEVAVQNFKWEVISFLIAKITFTTNELWKVFEFKRTAWSRCSFEKRKQICFFPKFAFSGEPLFSLVAILDLFPNIEISELERLALALASNQFRPENDPWLAPLLDVNVNINLKSLLYQATKSDFIGMVRTLVKRTCNPLALEEKNQLKSVLPKLKSKEKFYDLNGRDQWISDPHFLAVRRRDEEFDPPLKLNLDIKEKEFLMTVCFREKNFVYAYQLWQKMYFPGLDLDMVFLCLKMDFIRGNPLRWQVKETCLLSLLCLQVKEAHQKWKCSHSFSTTSSKFSFLVIGKML